MTQLAGSLKKGSFTTDVFTIPFKDGYILYIPESGIVVGVENRVHELIQNIKDLKPVDDNSFSREWINALSKLKVFEPKVEKPEELDEFLPTHVTLSLTSRCPLRCVYCYACAAEVITDMDEEIIDTGINLVTENAVKKGQDSFKVGFHGEGEPTANWPLFRKAILKAEKNARDRKMSVTFTMSTNAIWNRSQREFIAKHFKSISISLDGPPPIQNRQRPKKNGVPSFPIVFDNLKFLEKAGITYSIRATVLPDSIDWMIPFLEMVSEELKCDWVHFEPVAFSGRAKEMVLNRNHFFRSFVDEYHKAVVKGGELGIRVAYSGCRSSQYSSNFCKASGAVPNFFVTTGGLVSSCFELIDPNTPKGKFTVYGYYNRAKQSFIFDEKKLRRIMSFGVKKIAHCRNCFARWSCSGDCLVRSDLFFDGEGNLKGSQESPRCLANRETTLYDLVRFALVMGYTGVDQKPIKDNRLKGG